jgi:cyclophilin family peptidyl-prolyl cis-trans isomerase
MEPNRNPKGPLIIIGGIILLGVILSLVLLKKQNGPENQSPAPVESVIPSETPATEPSAAPSAEAAVNKVDLTTDEQGLSKSIVSIETEKGKIEFKFYPKDAPQTVNRIVELIQKGFYNGLTFHRVVPGFVIQGGDPEGRGTGGSGQKLKAEFNARKHIPGAVAMARSQDPDSADSQFYIALGTIPHLDGNYTVFGQVISGQDVVEKIAVDDKMTKVEIK